ncbi:hypothetical protein [Enterococcus sp. DIV0840]|uniref:hypothetical protein n=1 Tax=Enterococcus sp. DIV0840 TaxID=2775001 RepID=UPI003D2FB98F
METFTFLLGIPRNYQVGQIDQKILKPALEEVSVYFDHLSVFMQNQPSRIEIIII